MIKPVSISENILRAETAAIVSVFLFSLLLSQQEKAGGM